MTRPITITSSSSKNGTQITTRFVDDGRVSEHIEIYGDDTFAYVDTGFESTAMFQIECIPAIIKGLKHLQRKTK